jgi:NAD(P)-dependent dehydrogenase (short-subunit alcohol dehydrogenase family)
MTGRKKSGFCGGEAEFSRGGRRGWQQAWLWAGSGYVWPEAAETDMQRVLVLGATGGIGAALVLGGQGPEKSLRGLDPGALARQFALNAAGPVLVLKHALRLMPRDRVVRFAALSARVGSIGDNGLGGWYSYRAAKAALNQLIHTAAIEVGRSHPQAVVVTLHPGTVATSLTDGYRGTHPAVPAAAAASALLAVLDRLTPADTGGFFDQNGLVIPW